jgi:hypothetical protein
LDRTYAPSSNRHETLVETGWRLLSVARQNIVCLTFYVLIVIGLGNVCS